VDIDNVVLYQGDKGDPGQFAQLPPPVAPSNPKNFFNTTVIGDIVKVNDVPVKGLAVFLANVVGTSLTPGAGTAIADVARNSLRLQYFEILDTGSKQIGTIMGFGYNGGTAPPGSHSDITGGNFAIVGGTGAYLGARGQTGPGARLDGINAVTASIAEDPSVRRSRAGAGKIRIVLSVIPDTRPAIVSMPILSTKTAPGSIITITATGLGPTEPSVNPGDPFPLSPAYVVRGPVQVTFNGIPFDVVSAAGVPGATGVYRVDVRVPSSIPTGDVDIRVISAWIPSAPYMMSIK
jgi:hypothetical protein